MKNFRERLTSHETLVGAMVTLPTASTAEVLAESGFDWLFIDAEHGPLDISDIQSILQAVGSQIPCVVRVPECSEAWIKRVLDLGADGIIVPQTNTPEQVADVVRYARYAPLGSRGVGLARAHGYGFSFEDYVSSANDRVAVIVQAEHRLAVENIDAIIATGGFDAMLLGPYDMSASYGKMGQINAPDVIAGIGKVIDRCKTAGIPVGSFGVTSEAIQSYSQQGCTLLCAGVDVLFLGNAARQMRKSITSH